jgi:hypothetical protein
MKDDTPLKRFIYRHSGKIGLFAGLVTFLGVAIGAYVATGRFAALQIERARAVTTLGVADKIDFVIQRFAEGAWTQFNLLTTVTMLVGVIASVALGAWVTEAADNRPPSFVLLSKKAEEDQKKEMRRRQRRWVIFFLSIATSIAAGVIANAVFALALGLLL